MKRNKDNIYWGIALILVGVLFWGNLIDLWKVNLFFDGWWTLFIIVPSFVGLFRKGQLVGSTIGVVIGLLFLLACQDIIIWSMVGRIFIPFILIVIGLSIIFKPTLDRRVIKTLDSKGSPVFTAIFSGSEERIKGEFKGATCTSIFGGVELDLRNAEIKDDVVIECTSIFGGTDIFVPDDVIIKAKGVPIFGGIENKAKQDVTKNSKTVYINYTCVFGGIDIK